MIPEMYSQDRYTMEHRIWSPRLYGLKYFNICLIQTTHYPGFHTEGGGGWMGLGSTSAPPPPPPRESLRNYHDKM